MRLIPESADRADWPRLVAKAVNALIRSSGSGGSVAWGDVTGKPSTFPPSTHGHGPGDITGFPLSGQAVVTLPNNAFSVEETVTVTGMTASRTVIVSLAPHSDDDENDADLIDLAAVSATPNADALTITAAFLTPHAGSIRFNWSAF